LRTGATGLHVNPTTYMHNRDAQPPTMQVYSQENPNCVECNSPHLSPKGTPCNDHQMSLQFPSPSDTSHTHWGPPNSYM